MDQQGQYHYPPATPPNQGTNPYAESSPTPKPRAPQPQFPTVYQPAQFSLPTTPSSRPRRPAALVVGLIFALCFAAAALTIGGFSVFTSAFFSYAAYGRLTATTLSSGNFFFITGVAMIVFPIFAMRGRWWGGAGVLATALASSIYCYLYMNQLFLGYVILMAVSVLPFIFPSCWRFYRDFSA